MDQQKTSDEDRTALRKKIMACYTHPERVATIKVHGKNKCRECFMGGRAFDRFLRQKKITAAQYWSRPQNQIDLFGSGEP